MHRFRMSRSAGESGIDRFRVCLPGCGLRCWESCSRSLILKPKGETQQRGVTRQGTQRRRCSFQCSATFGGQMVSESGILELGRMKRKVEIWIYNRNCLYRGTDASRVRDQQGSLHKRCLFIKACFQIVPESWSTFNQYLIYVSREAHVPAGSGGGIEVWYKRALYYRGGKGVPIRKFTYMIFSKRETCCFEQLIVLLVWR